MRVTHPGTWQTMSFDMKLLFVHHATTLVMFVAGGKLTARSELTIWIVLVSVLLSLSIRHRRQIGWRWPGASRANYSYAAVGLVLGGIFVGSSALIFPPTEPRALPWYLGALGLLAFGIASTLRLTSTAEADFVSRDEASEHGVSAESTPTPRWKKWVRVAFGILAIAVWLESIASVTVFGLKHREGSLSPTSAQTEPLMSHGNVTYITPSDKALIDVLNKGAAIGIPAIIALGLILHFGLHIGLSPDRAD